MQLTRAQRRKLAKAARELAMECAAGTAPEFGTGVEFKDGRPCCAMGHVSARAGVFDEYGYRVTVGSAGVTDKSWWAVADANDADRDALPWTLLWLADELESQP